LHTFLPNRMIEDLNSEGIIDELEKLSVQSFQHPTGQSRWMLSRFGVCGAQKQKPG
jgi:hypothetical protein